MGRTGVREKLPDGRFRVAVGHGHRIEAVASFMVNGEV